MKLLRVGELGKEKVAGQTNPVFLKNGDTIELEIESLGRQTHNVRDQ